MTELKITFASSPFTTLSALEVPQGGKNQCFFMATVYFFPFQLCVHDIGFRERKES